MSDQKEPPKYIEGTPDHAAVMTLDMFNKFLFTTAPVNFQHVVEAFLSVKFGLECDVEIDDTSERDRYSIGVKPCFFDCPYEPEDFEEVAKQMASFLMQAKSGRGGSSQTVFPNVWVDIVKTIHG